MSAIAKILLSSLLVVAIVGAALWIMGGKQSEYSTALSIDAPPEAIFPYLTQPEHLKRWTSGLSEVEELLPAPKIDGLATSRAPLTSRVVSLADGKQTRFSDQVIRYEENVSISVQSTNDQQVLTGIYQLEPRDGQTFVSYRIKSASCGIGRFMAPLLGNDFQNRIDGDIRQLKTLVESSPHPVAAKAPARSNVPPAADTNQLDGSTPDVSVVPVSNDANLPSAETPVSGQPFSF